MSESAEYLASREDTIVALSSPPGPAPRAVIRLSGRRAVGLAEGLLVRDDDWRRLAALRWGAQRVRLAVERGAALDIDLWLMRAPRSYTGEDLVELHLPGSPALIDVVLERLRDAGARPALPGEYTERAFLNGRIDLAQAEAVAALIHAASEDERRAALTVLDGRASRELEAIAEGLKRLLALIELDLDFSDQDVEIVPPAGLDAELAALERRLERELARRRGMPAGAGGERLLLVGATNAGKSSLFNSLQEGQRALVSDRPGTTRDYLEAELELGRGRVFTLVDCAGEGHEELEEDRLASGQRAGELARAEALIEVLDGRGLTCDFRPRSGALVAVATRADLVPPAARPPVGVVWVSAVTGEGLAELRAELAGRLRRRGSGALYQLAARQGRLLERCLEAVRRARRAAAERIGEELVAADLHQALAALREISGEDYDDQVLAAIMRDFCIGK